MGSDWTTLTGCLVLLIAERLLANDVTDYIRFRAVCNSWRQHTEDPRVGDGLEPRYLPRSWIMLEEAPVAPFRHRFLNTNSGGVITVDIPELEDCDVLGPSLGGLLTLREKRTHALGLFHPLTSYITQLPPLVSLLHPVANDPTLVEPEYHQPTAIGFSDGWRTVAIFCKMVDKVAVAKPGDWNWRWISVRPYLMKSAASVAGYFFLVSKTTLFELSSDGAHGHGLPRVTPVADVPVPGGVVPSSCRHTLVEDDGDRLTLVKEKNRTSEESDRLDKFFSEVNITLIVSRKA
uniref:KIB1-4 beta-propeller domain-containing protein n=1 Tax=Oryza brachyantha TaxID=4533 RepID=J3MLJ2_ORYBR